MSNTVPRKFSVLSLCCLLTITTALTVSPKHSSAQSPWAVCATLQLPDPVSTILELTHDDFQVRQRAANALLDEGVAAWDWLYRACDSSDTEIATTSRRILSQVSFEKTLARHVPILTNYRTANIAQRTRMIIRLGQSNSASAQVALALLTRFELDEQLSRLAAIELITAPQRPISGLSQWITTSSRTASGWLRIHTSTAANLQNFVGRWHPAMQNLVKSSFFDQQPATTRRFLQWYTEQLLLRGEAELIDWSVEHITASVADDPLEVIETLDWLLLYRQFDACDLLANRFPQLMQNDSRLVYRRAELARLRGNLLQAEDIAASVIQKDDADEHLIRLQSAINLQLAGLHHWASRAMSKLIDEQTTQPSVRIQACALLAELQYQDLDFSAAAETLAIALTVHQEPGDSAVTLLNDDLKTRFHLFTHLAAVDSGDWATARACLLDGLEAAPGDSDLLIAMLRYSSADMSTETAGQWRRTSVELIELTLQERADRIEELRVGYDRDARQARLRNEYLVAELNAYAWLASQSGVALHQAEAFAREANELSPSNGHVLDTLASCLFARAKLGEAVAYQQLALREAPWSRQIRSGLVRYRQAMMLAEMQGLFR